MSVNRIYHLRISKPLAESVFAQATQFSLSKRNRRVNLLFVPRYSSGKFIPLTTPFHSRVDLQHVTQVTVTCSLLPIILLASGRSPSAHCCRARGAPLSSIACFLTNSLWIPNVLPLPFLLPSPNFSFEVKGEK